MKLVRVLAIISAVTVAVYAQGTPPPIPDCAEGCIQGGLGSSNCNPTDFKCQCADTEALGTVMDCVKAKCQASQIPGIIAAASAICAEYGGNDISNVLKSIVASPTSLVASEASSRITSVSGSQRIIPTATATETSSANETSTAPTSTESPNGVRKNAISSSLGFIIAGLVAIGI
ncbi:hypothetical protein TWF106_001049 [Orbilia oligospora]|uniref:CFEM domain-containing protein n=1 Tax=Orbilia oligospora TaxID=2813651 RepID=A0A7C8K666_ORBOL|nr:hypothetical protein TWF788_002334 [Orbilia oligospora]KAF3198710.1 hypothetical protein TWF679_001801 [Orbilia oligospora]KAF3205727.1 hypothetical protein TWF106_001049 [Orbilia oligospora]